MSYLIPVRKKLCSGLPGEAAGVGKHRNADKVDWPPWYDLIIIENGGKSFFLPNPIINWTLKPKLQYSTIVSLLDAVQYAATTTTTERPNYNRTLDGKWWCASKEISQIRLILLTKTFICISCMNYFIIINSLCSCSKSEYQFLTRVHVQIN